MAFAACGASWSSVDRPSDLVLQMLCTTCYGWGEVGKVVKMVGFLCGHALCNALVCVGWRLASGLFVEVPPNTTESRGQQMETEQKWRTGVSPSTMGPRRTGVL